MSVYENLSLSLSTWIVVGASTGGPRVLTELLEMLPPLRACILIVQHMPKFINPSFVKTLSRAARTEVCLANEGDRLVDGRILVAPSEVHCTLVGNNRVHLAPGPSVNFVCPSIDVTMQSLKPPPPGGRIFGVLLTGMGKDGAAGLAHIKQLGGTTLAQCEATCAVYGMPAEAVRRGCVDYQLPPDRIARFLAQKAAG
jgi:two-component system, chemotaxis family, protein-glutamate methylesterase/glutaminase